MATRNQISFLKNNIDIIIEPVLIVGSKHYEFDKEDIRERLKEMGKTDVTGIDISEGEGVDYVVDITDSECEFLKEKSAKYSTVICMEVLTHVRNPFKAAVNLSGFLKEGGTAILSECYTRKISKMPIDLWRFTYDGTKELFKDLKFSDERARVSLTREKDEKLLPLKYPLPQLMAQKSDDENAAGYFLRRLHRKYFAKGIFRISRLLPETTIYSIGKK
ncbi:MAG TPA: methyltransferase domain-containing protein [Ignavibacteria bacterium]|nr:methyltransferase domain-containing protein [Ignavibacteria bacterium]